VVILPEDPVERFDPPLVRDQVIAAAPFEQADVEPVVLHVPAPGVKVRRLWLRPGRKHHSPGATVTLLETWRDAAKPFTADAPSLDAGALASQRPGGNLEDSARVRVVIGAGAIAKDPRAGSGERSFGQRCRIPLLELLERFTDSPPIGDGRQEP